MEGRGGRDEARMGREGEGEARRIASEVSRRARGDAAGRGGGSKKVDYANRYSIRANRYSLCHGPPGWS
jgi:hypothetical protein